MLTDWLPEHNSPELQYIETKWASLMSYGLSADKFRGGGRKVLLKNGGGQTLWAGPENGRQSAKKTDEPVVGSGHAANQQITFLSDGADNVRSLQYCMYPESTHVLDWFHVTMRLTVLGQFAKGLERSDPAAGDTVKQDLESAKWYLWHGNVKRPGKDRGLLADL